MLIRSIRRSLPLVMSLATLWTIGCGGPTKPTTPPPDPFPDGPKIVCPTAPSALTSPNGQPIAVSFGTPIATGGAPSVSVVCSPPSGAEFPIGNNAVVCTATDGRQRTDSCTFNIVVQQPPKLTVTGFVAFGDSITYGEDGRASLIASGGLGQIRPSIQFPASLTYPGVLTQSLRVRYTTQQPSVSNAGLPSEKAGAAATLSRFNSVISNRSFDAVLLLEGTNDIYDRDAGEIPAAITGLRRMLQSAKGRGMRAFLATVPPMVPGSPRGLAWSLVPTLNDQIRSLAASEGVTLVDVHAAFGQSFEQYLGGDGLHPNEAGYAKIADTFFTAVKGTLEAQPSTSATSPTGIPVFRPFSIRPRR